MMKLLSNINLSTVLFAGEDVCKMTADKFIGRGLSSNMNLSPLSLCRKKCLQSDSGEKFIGRGLLSSLCFFLLLTITGCASNVEVFHSTNSLGKQLEDLNQAYKSDAISDKEYKQAKEILIDHYK